MINFDFIRAGSSKAAVDAVKKDNNAQFIAGGTNLVDLMKKGIAAPEKLIDITTLPLKEIKAQGNKLHIGALALNADVADHATVLKQQPLLALALRAGASQQIRNMATVGGNMLQRTRCSYFYNTEMPCNKREPNSGCGALKGYNRMHAIFGASEKCIAVHPSDMCIALAALDATVIVTGTKGERRIPFVSFHRLPGDTPEKDNNLEKGELILGVEIPDNRFTHVHYLKLRDRSSYAFALVSVAVAMELQNNVIKDVRLAMGGVAHKPWRLTEAENILKGKTASESVFQQAAEAALRDAKAYGQNNFKLKLAPNAVVNALKTAWRKA